MFDTKVMVAPNSPSALAKQSPKPAIRHDKRIATHSSGVRSSIGVASTERRSRRRPDKVREAVGLEHRLGSLRAQKIEITRGGRLRLHGQRHRIDDRGMRIRREAAD